MLHEALYDALAGRPRSGFPAIDAQDARKRYFVRKAERLCGVALFKRIGSDVELDDPRAKRWRPLFHSTAHVASAPLRTRFTSWHKNGAIDAYAQALFAMCTGDDDRERILLRRASNEPARINSPFAATEGFWGGELPTPVAFGVHKLDGQVLYADQLGAVLEEVHRGFAEERDIEARSRIVDSLKARLADLLNTVGIGIDEVPAYYAVLQADGDAMGGALERVGRARGVEGRRKLAAALDDFSTKCREVVQNHAGSLVYAGGDDVLALLPLHTALACARALHDLFGEHMSAALHALGDHGRSPTLSVGLGIGHHLADMRDVRALARSAEHRAKQFEGKDAFAISAQMRSGGRLDVVGSFAASRPLDQRLTTWARLLLTEAIPTKASHDLEAAMAPLLAGGAPAHLSAVARSIANRVLDRKRGEHGAEQLSTTVRGHVEDFLSDAEGTTGDVARQVAVFAREENRGSEGLALAVHCLSRELSLAKLISEAMKVAFERLNSVG